MQRKIQTSEQLHLSLLIHCAVFRYLYILCYLCEIDATTLMETMILMMNLLVLDCTEPHLLMDSKAEV